MIGKMRGEDIDGNEGSEVKWMWTGGIFGGYEVWDVGIYMIPYLP